MTWVVKLGGSLHADPALQNWLAMLLRDGGGKVVIVPGGGPFADQVRVAQRRWGFNDKTAHHMALLAMEQFGLQLMGMNSALVGASSLSDIQRHIAESRVVIWMPSETVLSAPDIAANWNVTSDSLAAWLTKKLDAARLVLVKSCAIPAGARLVGLAASGIVDAAFVESCGELSCQIEVVEKDAWERVSLTLTGS